MGAPPLTLRAKGRQLSPRRLRKQPDYSTRLRAAGKPPGTVGLTPSRHLDHRFDTGYHGVALQEILHSPAKAAGTASQPYPVVNMGSLQEALRTALPRMGPNQRAIAEFLLERPDEGAFLTASELGRRVGVSESTVVRFAASVGFPGYPELQRAVQEELRSRLSTVERMRSGLQQARGHAQTLYSVWQNDIENINRTFQQLDPGDFERAVELLSGARRIYVIGLRTSACLAVLLTTSLLYLGREAVRVELGIGDHWERLDLVGPGDVAVAISVPRYTRWTVELVKYARSRGANAIAVTDSAVSPLGAVADVVLPAVTHFNAFIESFAAPLSLLNALILGVAMRDEQRSLDVLRRREALWREQQVYIEPGSAGADATGGG